jgi:hypothetical protein
MSKALILGKINLNEDNRFKKLLAFLQKESAKAEQDNKQIVPL